MANFWARRMVLERVGSRDGKVAVRMAEQSTG